MSGVNAPVVNRMIRYGLDVCGVCGPLNSTDVLR